MISIILPTFNNEDTIFYSINSIICQTYKDFELIIINDFSTDNTKKMIKSFNDSRIVYLENDKNMGIAYSLIKGIKKAKGDYIARIDGDDIALPKRLDIQLNYLIRNPNIDLIGSNIIYFTKNIIMGVSDLKIYKKNKFDFFFNTIDLPHGTWMAKSNFFRNFNYDQKAVPAEDQDLLLRAYNFCKFAILPEPLMFYRIPYATNINYKLKQISKLFIARSKYILSNKLFFYLPLILFVFITSLIFYIFKIKKNKSINTYNLKHQTLLNKIIDKNKF